MVKEGKTGAFVTKKAQMQPLSELKHGSEEEVEGKVKVKPDIWENLN
jgi:hypothetical protein